MSEVQATPEVTAPAQSTNSRPTNDRQRNDRRPRRNDMPQEEKAFDERVIHIDRVARVVKGGRRFRFRALVVVGDRKGSVGVGVAKGADVTAAVAKATDVAKKVMFKVVTHKDTVAHDTTARVGASVILIKPAPIGTGLIAGGVVRTVLEVACIKNAVCKSLGSSNRVNLAYSTIAALKLVVPSKDWHVIKAVKKAKATKEPKVEAK
jgi:small subunit ribosomal protein S5